MVIEHADRFGLAQLHQLRDASARPGEIVFSHACSKVSKKENAGSTPCPSNDGFQIADSISNCAGRANSLERKGGSTPRGQHYRDVNCWRQRNAGCVCDLGPMRSVKDEIDRALREMRSRWRLAMGWSSGVMSRAMGFDRHPERKRGPGFAAKYIRLRSAHDSLSLCPKALLLAAGASGLAPSTALSTLDLHLYSLSLSWSM